LYGLWHIAMSAFAAPLRIHLAFAATAIVCVAMERMPLRGQAASALALRPRPSIRQPPLLNRSSALVQTQQGIGRDPF
jgi:hypothetical protein